MGSQKCSDVDMDTRLDSFAVAAVANDHKPGGFKQFSRWETNITASAVLCSLWRLQGKISFLAFSASRSHLCLLACGPFYHLHSSQIASSNLFLSDLCSHLHSSLTHFNPPASLLSLQLGPTWLIQDNLPPFQTLSLNHICRISFAM